MRHLYVIVTEPFPVPIKNLLLLGVDQMFKLIIKNLPIPMFLKCYITIRCMILFNPVFP